MNYFVNSNPYVFVLLLVLIGNSTNVHCIFFYFTFDLTLPYRSGITLYIAAPYAVLKTSQLVLPKEAKLNTAKNIFREHKRI